MTNSPYHDAELRLHGRTGKGDLAATLGKRVTDRITEEAATLLPPLPFLVCASIDAAGRPWASIIAGEPGFLTFDERCLRLDLSSVRTDTLGDLAHNPDIGLLAVDLENRRRFRINGRACVRDGLLHVEVLQCYRNCPQYINGRRARHDASRLGRSVTVSRLDRVRDPARAIVADADTFFIATHGSGQPSDDHRLGADVSHRGGNPGFVGLNDDGTVLSFPDYTGNYMFNTLGNIARYPRCGLLFIDFSAGTVVRIAGRANVDWDVQRALSIPGAQRMVDVAVDEVVVEGGCLPLAWGAVERASDLRKFRKAEPVAMAAPRQLGAVPAESGFMTAVVAGIVDESDTMRSFHLRLPSGALPPSAPGQHILVRLPDAAGGRPLIRSYSLAGFRESPDEYRICVRKVGDSSSSASHRLHTEIEEGHELLISAPRGTFVLDQSHDRPVALVSVGIGITPMISMLEALVAGRRNVDIHFIHGARNSREHAFGADVRRIAAGFAHIGCHFRYSQPGAFDVMGRDHDSVGRVDAALVQSMVSVAADVYLCGTAAFMDEMRERLVRSGFRNERIFHESFGSARGEVARENIGAVGAQITFARSGRMLAWDGNNGSILDAAESIGLSLPSSCRSGDCGSCQQALVSGEVGYPVEPSYHPDAGHVLLCCAQPRSDMVIDA